MYFQDHRRSAHEVGTVSVLPARRVATSLTFEEASRSYRWTTERGAMLAPRRAASPR